MIRPIPEGHGVGFCSPVRLPEYAGKYREENVGRFWNYYFTEDCYEWPDPIVSLEKLLIDGFSPNLNKSLHVGHLRQLALARSLRCMLSDHSLGEPCEFVALLGASQGVFQYAVKELNEWFDFVNYHPTIYYDVLMPQDQDIVPRYYETPLNQCPDGMSPQLFDGPDKDWPVVVVRSDGRPTYAFWDISFAKTVGPTHYITGVEQKEHFESIGLGDKHLPMGLVLGTDGKKMKSRTGDSVSAKEILEQVIANLNETEEPKKLAWNVLAWNFLHVARPQNVKFNAEDWTKPDAPGMYITYTYARIKSAFCKVQNIWNISKVDPAQRKALDRKFDWDNYLDHDQHLRVQQSWLDAVPAWSKQNPDPHYDLQQKDIDLLGFAAQYNFYKNQAMKTLDPAVLANYTYDIARKLGSAYHTEKIDGGRYGFQYAVAKAADVLFECIVDLGMFPLQKV